MTILQQGWSVLLLLAAPLLPNGLPTPGAPPSVHTATVNLRTPAPFPVKQPDAVQPVVGAKSAMVLDLPSNTPLYSKDIDTSRPIASLTKLMTALIVTEKLKPDETVTVPKLPTTADESRMGLVEGEQFRADDLLAGMLIASANDAAYTLAVKTSGSEKDFVKLMNDKAAELGLTHTHFANASGYDQGDSYSSARDLSVIARAAIADPRISGVVRLKDASVSSLNGHEYKLSSTDELLGSYLPIAGLKTGTTDAAGLCLVSLLSAGDRQLLAVVLNSPDRFQENKSMLDWSLRSYRW